MNEKTYNERTTNERGKTQVFTEASSRRLKAGYLYNIHYKNYKDDPNPTILVLYSGDTYTHAININYLSKNLTSKLISMIAAIATKRLAYKESYTLYHGYIKNKLPGIVKVAYRTYFTKKITRKVPLSKGFFSIKHFLTNISRALPEKDYKLVRKKLKVSLGIAKVPAKQAKAIRIFSLFKKNEKITRAELQKRAKDYMEEIRLVTAAKDEKERKKRNTKKYTYL